MADVTLAWTGDRLQFVGSTSYGEPLLVGGNEEGPGAKPSDLVPMSLAACTAYDVVAILRKQRQDLHRLEVTVRSRQDPDPPWTFRAMHMRFVLTGAVDTRMLRCGATSRPSTVGAYKYVKKISTSYC